MAYTQRSAPPKPPLKGSFPLDHDGDCKTIQQQYMSCLQKNNYVATYCRDLSRQYLQCRQANGLMAEEDMNRLGFDQGSAELVDNFNQRLASGDLKRAQPKRFGEK